MIRRRSPVLELLRAHPQSADVVLAAALAVLSVVGRVATVHDSGGHDHLDAGAVLLCLLATLPIAVRRRWPLPVLLVTALGTTVQVSLDYWSTFLAMGVLVAVYTVAAYRPMRESVLGVGAAVAMTVVCLAIAPEPVTTSAWISSIITMSAAAVVGRNIQLRRAHLLTLEERARQTERDREQWVRQAVTAERQRIARELHDVVAHNVSVIGVLAAGARRTLRRNPAATDDTLATMESTSRSTLREMRHLLDVLRLDDEPPGAPSAPQPGTAGLPALVEQVTEAGLAVSLTVSGHVAQLTPGLDLSAYRIVQEALTNALKHAGPATAVVRLVYGSRALVLTVSDDGRGPGQGRVGGHGLLGMRERVALYGGSIEVGARTGGGFQVRAELPLDADENRADPVEVPLPTATMPAEPATAPAAATAAAEAAR